MPQIKPAGFFWQAVLTTLGFAAIYVPGRIYILPEYVHSPLLRAHELCHYYQRLRDGFCVFWFFVFWYLLFYGYWSSPYEIEAREYEKLAYAR